MSPILRQLLHLISCRTTTYLSCPGQQWREACYQLQHELPPEIWGRHRSGKPCLSSALACNRHRCLQDTPNRYLREVSGSTLDIELGMSLPTPSAPVFVSIVATPAANCWIEASVFEAWKNPISSPQPPTAIMILAFGNSDLMVEIGTLGWKAAVAFAIAKARTT